MYLSIYLSAVCLLVCVSVYLSISLLSLPLSFVPYYTNYGLDSAQHTFKPNKLHGLDSAQHTFKPNKLHGLDSAQHSFKQTPWAGFRPAFTHSKQTHSKQTPYIPFRKGPGRFQVDNGSENRSGPEPSTAAEKPDSPTYAGYQRNFQSFVSGSLLHWACLNAGVISTLTQGRLKAQVFLGNSQCLLSLLPHFMSKVFLESCCTRANELGKVNGKANIYCIL